MDELPGSPAPMSAKGECRMALYEHTVMTRQDISAQQAEALNDTIKALIEEGGGSVAKIEYWGLRNLTYRVKKRQLSINEDVLRWLTIRVEELDLELSPLLARRERERDRSAPRGEDAAASE